MARNHLKLKSTDGAQSNSCITPIKIIKNDTDYSPVFMPCTQESLDNVDVFWDWSSPQSKCKPNCKPKRIISAQKSSPKLAIRKSRNHPTPSFDKITNELRAIREELDIAQSASFIFDDSELGINNQEDKKDGNSAIDLFNDSLEQDLIMVSQQVEEQLKHSSQEPSQLTNLAKKIKSPVTPETQMTTKSSPRTLTKSFSSNTLLDAIDKTPTRSTYNFNGKLQELKMDDSLVAALQAFEDDMLIENDKNSPTTMKEISASSSSAAGSANPLNSCANTSSRSPGDQLKLKTKSLSFGDSYVKHSNDDALQREIEKKKLAALAKLRARKQLPNKPVLSDSDSSPIKCSPEEIELKRQQARAKLEMKKQQELIQRNRQEALKRLQNKRRKQI